MYTILMKQKNYVLPIFIILPGLLSLYSYAQSKRPVLKIPMGHQQAINSVAFSSGGNLIATGSGDNTFIIWDAKTGYEIRKVNAGAPVQQVIFSPDASYVITVTGQNEAQASVHKPVFKKWEVRTGKLLTNLPFTGSPGLTFLKVSGTLLVPGYSEDLSGKKNSDLEKSSIMMKDPEKFAKQYESAVNYDSLGKVAERRAEEIIKKMGNKDMTDKKNLEEFNKEIMKQFLEDAGSVVALNPLNKNYTLLDPGNLKPVGQLNRGFENYKIISYNNKDYLLSAEYTIDPSASPKNAIDVWELKDLTASARENKKSVPWKKFPVSSQPYHIAASPAKGFFANDTGHNIVQLRQVDKNAPLTSIKPKGKSLVNMEFSPDGNILYIYSNTVVVQNTARADVTRYIEGWSTQTFQQVTFIKLPEYYGYQINLSPAGDYFTVVNVKNLVKLNQFGDSIGEFKGRSASPSYFGFSPEGRQVSVNYQGYPDMSEFMLLSTTAGVEAEAYNNNKVLTNAEKEKLVKEKMKIFAVTRPGSYNGYNLNWDLTRGGASVKTAAAFSSDHQTISADKNYSLVNEQFESGNRESNPYTAGLIRQMKGLSKETAEKLKQYLDTGSTYYKVMFAGQFNGPVTLLINKKTKDSISLIKIDSLDWIMVLRNGYYMTSKNGAKALGYVSGMQVFPFEQFDIKNNRPDLVLKAIGLADSSLIKAYRNAYLKRIKKLEIDTTQFKDEFEIPEADFGNRDKIDHEQKTGKLSLTITAKDNNNTLSRFNVWNNEVPVFGKNGRSIKEAKSNRLNTTVEVTLSEGINRLETSVMNTNGVESYRVPLIVKYIPDKPGKKTTHFIGIGIDQFADSKYNLQYSVKDIRDLSARLKEKYAGNIIIDTLLNENVTVTNVKALKQKLRQTTENDKVIIAYSGHGMLSKSYDYYLSTYSINFEKPEQNGLSYEELENLLDSIPARKKLMLIDACHSGEVDKDEVAKMVVVQKQLDPTRKGVIILEDTANKRVGMKNSFDLMQDLFVNVGRSTGATIISAAAGTQFALEKGDLKNGVFTYSILELMKQTTTTTISELKKYVNQRVTELTKGMQVPTSRNENVVMDWVVW